MSDQIASLIPPELVPPSISDDRQRALAQAFGEALAEIDLSALAMVDPLTVDARLLPYMIREFGAQAFVDPDLPEAVQRNILKNIWRLKSLHGYDAGVKLGLELLGVETEISHWHQTDPKGAANTQRLTLKLGPALFAYQPAAQQSRELDAAIRMVKATQRLSQEITFVLRRQATRSQAIGRAMHTGAHTTVGIHFAPTAAPTRRTRATALHRTIHTVIGPAQPRFGINATTRFAGTALHRTIHTTIGAYHG